jgi:hypothetical protein
LALGFSEKVWNAGSGRVSAQSQRIGENDAGRKMSVRIVSK